MYALLQSPPSLENMPIPRECLQQWRRPGRADDLLDHTPCVLFQSIAPNDIMQGSLGDCWLLAAMASLAEHRPLVRKLFAQRTVDHGGRYDIRLFEPVRKKWTTITIDDKLPIDPTGELFFAKATAEGNFPVCRATQHACSPISLTGISTQALPVACL